MGRFLCVMMITWMGVGFVFAQDDELGVAKSRTYEAIDLQPLMDSMSHWRKRYGRDRNDRQYAPTQIVLIAENLVGLQNEDGGGQRMSIGRLIFTPIRCGRVRVCVRCAARWTIAVRIHTWLIWPRCML